MHSPMTWSIYLLLWIPFCTSFQFKSALTTPNSVGFQRFATFPPKSAHRRENTIDIEIQSSVVLHSNNNNIIQTHQKSGCNIRDLEEKDLVPLVLMATHEFGQGIEPDWLLAFTIYWGFRFRLLVSENFEDHKVFVAVDGNEKIAACCEISFQPTNGQSAPAIPGLKIVKKIVGFPCPLRPYISNLLVSPVYRRKGLAKSMVSVCEAKALEWGEDVIYLHCDMEYLPATELYFGMGYERIKDEPYWIGLLTGIRLRWMRKNLDITSTKTKETKVSTKQEMRQTVSQSAQ